MTNVSVWSETRSQSFARVEASANFDVLVVGAGITGLTTAYLLKQAGKRVAVLERDRVGSGETSRTSAHVTYVTDLRLSEIARRFGEDNAALVWRGGAEAISLIEELTRACAIDCGFARVPGFLYSSPVSDKDESEELRREQKFAERLGFDAEFVVLNQLAGRPAVRYENQAIIHPMRYITGLAKAVNGDGCAVYENSEADEFEEEPLAVTVNGHRLTCEEIVIATHVPLTGIKSLLPATLFQTKLFPYTTYVLHATLPASSIEPGLYSDTADPYYYLRVHLENGIRHAVFGGMDHKTGTVTDTTERLLQLEAYFLGLFPNAHIEHRWSGQVIETADGLPYIGESAPDQFIATGYSGNGLTFSTLAATILRDEVLGRDSAWEKLFDPSRKKLLSGLGSVISENANYPLHMITDRLKPLGSDMSVIPRGEGRVVNINGQRVAVHRRGDNSLIGVSAVCTHLGCIVRWNESAETWDCPCHGSRFHPDGSVMGGPAETPLERVNVAQEQAHQSSNAARM